MTAPAISNTTACDSVKTRYMSLRASAQSIAPNTSKRCCARLKSRAKCLPWVFELAGKYDVRVIAMEVTHESHVDEIREALRTTGNPTGVMLQIGTRNTQNFELLKQVGRQQEYPVLFKRGFGITLDESLNAAEYLASEGNRNVVFGLRGMKTNMGDPHRNL